MTDPFTQLLFPVLMGVAFLILFWSFNRTLRAGRPMKAYEKKILSHGFLFMAGMTYFMAWDDQLAALLRLKGHDVWEPLSFGWAILLLYDARKRLQRQRETAPISEDVPQGSLTTAESFRAGVVTTMRCLLFFAVIGTIRRPTLPDFAVTGAIFLALFFSSRRRKLSSSQSEVSHS